VNISYEAILEVCSVIARPLARRYFPAGLGRSVPGCYVRREGFA